MDASTYQGIPLSREDIFCFLQRSIKQKDISCIRQAHRLIIGNGFGSITVLCDHLIRGYASCGSLFEANLIFCKIVDGITHAWQAIILAHVLSGENQKAIQLYQEMQATFTSPSKYVLSCALTACKNLGDEGEGRLIHDYTTKVGLDSDVIMGSALVDMYGKSGAIMEARQVFDNLPNKNVVSWGAIITCYTQQNMFLDALAVFEHMLEKAVEPDQVTFLCVLKACSSVGALQQGRIVHERIVKGSHEADMSIGNTLVDLYARSGSLEEARRLFDALPARNIVSCGAMIAGYAQFGQGHLAVELFRKMHRDNMRPNKVVYLCVLKACGSIGAIDEGMMIHGQIVDNGFDVDVLVGSSLIDMYAKCGGHEEAHRVLDELPERDVISWGAAISGFAQDGLGFFALDVFDKMQKEGVEPDKVSIMCALKACGSIGGIHQARLIHKEIISADLAGDLVIGNTLVDVYSKCGSFDDSQKVLEMMQNQDIVSWNALIAGYALNGQCEQAEQCLETIEEQGFKPDDKTYTSILAGCSHSGCMERGYHYFEWLEKELGNMPGVEMYSCMADLLGRSGRLREAIDLVYAAPSLPELVTWKSLLTSCRTYKSTELGRWAFDQMLHLDSFDGFGYVVVSNIYADANMWEKVEYIRGLRNMASAGKKPGIAFIETKDKVHHFAVGDWKHPAIQSIQHKLCSLQKRIRSTDHLPQLDLVVDLIQVNA